MTEYTEALRPSVGVYFIAALTLPIITLTWAPFSLPIGIASAIVVFVAICLALYFSAPKITVTATTFTAGKASIDRAYIGAVSAYNGDDARAERGVKLDARAWTLFRGYIDPVVKVTLTDDNDPTPYWLVSSRRPRELAMALLKNS